MTVAELEAEVDKAGELVKTSGRWLFRDCAKAALELIKRLPNGEQWRVLDACDRSSKYTYIWINHSVEGEKLEYRACPLDKLVGVFMSNEVSTDWKLEVLVESMDPSRASDRKGSVPLFPADYCDWRNVNRPFVMEPAAEILFSRLQECCYRDEWCEEDSVFRREMDRLERLSPGVIRNSVDRYGNNALHYHHRAYWLSNNVNCHYAGYGGEDAYRQSLILEEYGCDLDQTNCFGISRRDLRYGAVDEIRRLGERASGGDSRS